jgi:exopolysaccharide biosynthesis polyprenyl glycosylphosphotransferase
MLPQLSYYRIWKTALLPIVDFLSLFFGIWVVYLIRHNWFESSFFGIKRIPYSQYFVINLVLSTAIILTYFFLGVYNIHQRRSSIQNLFSLFLGVILVILVLITFFFFNEYNREALPQGVPVSRFILATGGFFAFYFVSLGRGLIWSLEQILYQFGYGKINVAVIGDKSNFLINQLKEFNYINKVFLYKELNQKVLETLTQKIEKGHLAEIYLYENNSKLGKDLALLAERKKVNFIFSPEGLANFDFFGLKPITFNKKLFLEILHSNLDGWQVVLKRLFDIFFSLIFLLCFSWLYLIIAIFIKLDSKGSIFYLSERVGPDEKVFKIWKFRRLKQEFCTSENNKKALEVEQKLILKKNFRKDGVLYKIHNDPRNTRVGKLIEKYSLDEIPQFFNVLMGDLSIVGPRPHQPREVAKYAKHHYKVLNIKPGLTGFAQVNGRSDLSFEEEVNYDTYYIEHWSFWLDLWIIIMTPAIIFFKKHKN